MTPGIQPSKVKIRLRKKLAIRPVMSTATGGSTTQKKYRSAFIFGSSSFVSVIELWELDVGCWSFVSRFRLRISAARNLQSPDSITNRGKGRVAAIQDLRFVPQYRSPYICQSCHCVSLAFQGVASRSGLRFLADRARPPLASRSLLPSWLHHICDEHSDKPNPRETPLTLTSKLQRRELHRGGGR